MDPYIVGIRFQKVGKIYHFDAAICRDLKVGDYAVVETSRGTQIGEVIQVIEKPVPPPDGYWKPVQRRATPRDLVWRQIWQQKELEATINGRAKLAEIGYPGVKVVGAEFAFDGSRLSLLYSTETEGKVDLRKLRTAMQRIYPRSVVDMRQIGPRDVAKLLGGMGACGLGQRCCSTFLTEFSPISIKMAKEQGISLTPTEITGMCGRLRCCLIYEYEQYVEARKSMPKRNKRVVTPKGEGKVVDIYPLKQVVVVELDTGMRIEVAHEDVQPWEELEALRAKAQQPCAKHGSGPCDCQKPAAAVAATDEEQPVEAELPDTYPLAAQAAEPAAPPPARSRGGTPDRPVRQGRPAQPAKTEKPGKPAKQGHSEKPASHPAAKGAPKGKPPVKPRPASGAADQAQAREYPAEDAGAEPGAVPSAKDHGRGKKSRRFWRKKPQ